MWETVHRAILAAVDWPLGWLLRLPSDAAVILVAILTSGLLTLLRRVATDQDWLRRAAADTRRLRDLAREARRRRDKDALARHGATVGVIKRRALRYEARPLLYAVVPVVLLAVWCFGRLEFHPPRAGERVEVRVRLATSAVGRPIHVVPQDGLASEGGWVRQVAEEVPQEPDGAWAAFNAWLRGLCGMTPPPGGVAVWRLAGDGSRPRYDLQFRFGDETFRKELCVGGRTYAPAVAAFDAGPVRSIELAMRPVKLFGLVGGMDWLGFPPWLVAYLVIAIPFVSILRRLFRVA
jgi:uncharacterized membrane protein (DUF106 family)